MKGGEDAIPERPVPGKEPPTPEGSAPKADEVYYCDLCGAVMLNLHCKLICERCGYKRDCSDP